MKRSILTYLAAVVLCLPAAAQPRTEMAKVEGGSYLPLYATGEEGVILEVDTFYLSKFAVTNEEFLAFIRENPSWRRSNVKRLFADDRYLRHWAGDLELGDAAPPRYPVVNISWFAARAYAEWTGMRLPTTAEWEYAASAGRMRPDGRNEDGFYSEILRQYATRSNRSMHPVDTTPANFWGVHGMHGQVWEWVDDFNSNLVTGESRNDTDLDRELFCGAAALQAADFGDYAAFIRFAMRSGLEADYTVSNLGFRLAAGDL